MTELRLLGSFEIKLANARSEVAASQPKRAALLAYLAAARPIGMHRRDEVLALLWPDTESSRARHALNQALYALRSALGEDAILSRGDSLIGLDRRKIWCDVTALHDALDAGSSVEALDLYRGPLLHGFHLAGGVEFERWLDAERSYLHERVSEAGWSVAELEPDPVQAARMARRAAGFSPYDEGVLRRLLTFLERRGDRPGAIQAYNAFATRLAEDFAVEPAEATKALMAQIAGGGGYRVDTRPHGGRAPTTPGHATGERATAAPSNGTRPGWRSYLGRRPLHVAVALVIGVALVALGLGSGSRPPPPVPHSFIVFPFSVTTDDSSLTWLGGGAAMMLANDLDSWEETRVVDRRRLTALADSLLINLDDDITLSDALAVAREGRAETVVMGELLAHAGALEIVVRRYDSRTGSEVDPVERAAGAAHEDVRPLIDGIAGRILGLGRGAGPAPDLRSATTYSLAAYRDYVRGMDALYAWEIPEAAAAFRAAIARDSSFAEAYHRLAVTLEWMPDRTNFQEKIGDTEASCRLTNAAIRHGARLPVKSKRHAEAYNAFVCEEDVRLARELYREIIATDSSDAEAWFHLANVEFWDDSLTHTDAGELTPRGDLNLALRGYLRAVELDPTFHLGYGNAFFLYSILNSTRFSAWDVTGDFLDADAPLDQVYFYLAWQDSIVFLPMPDPARDHVDLVGRFANDSASLAVRDSAALMARRWANAAPGLAAPRETLRDLHISRGAFDLALEEEIARFRLSRDTTGAPPVHGTSAFDNHIALRAALHLAIGNYDSALTLAEANLARQDEGDRRAPITTANVLVAHGQPHRALDEVIARFEPNRWWIPGTGDSAIEFTESVPLLRRIQFLGSAGVRDADLAALVDGLNRQWSEVYDEEDARVLRWRVLDWVGPALLTLDRAVSVRWFANAADPSSPRIAEIATGWRPYLAFLEDSLAAAGRALDDLAGTAGDSRVVLRPIELVAGATVARALDRHRLVIHFYDQLDESQSVAVTTLESRWALLTLSYFWRAQSYEALHQPDDALRYYRRFLAVWRNAEPSVVTYAHEARRALDRLAAR